MFRAIATLAAAFALVCTAQAAPAAGNPLLAPWRGPYGGVPPFDEIRVEHFVPALEAGLAAKRREIAAIAGSGSPATFANTVLALERSGRLLTQVQVAYALWGESLNTTAMQEVQRRMEPRLAAFNDEMTQNPRLYRRVEAVYRSAGMKRLSPEQQRLVWSYRTAFVKEGATLAPAAKRRVAAINQRLATLYTDFSQHLLAEEEGQGLVISDRADLEGLGAADVDAAAQEAARRGLGGRWVIANTRSAIEPFLTQSPRRGLREQAWRLFVNRGDNGDANDNNRIVQEILALRAERSKLLGFASYAHWQLSDTMAVQPRAALDLMAEVWQPTAARIREQIAQMQKLADEESQKAGVARFTIEPWDFRYYAEKLRRAEYDFDVAELTPYLQLDKLREAMFWAAGRLYGIRFEPVADVPVFHPDVTVYRVLDKEGSLVGLWYFDPYAREGKNSGAWMGSYRTQNRLFGVDVRPIVSNNSNFKRGKPGEPVLVTWDDAVTMFHEFGHALHGLLSDASYPSLAGPNALLDFGEFPSQVNEYWLPTPPVLAMLVNSAGQPLPQALIDKLQRSRHFDKPFFELEYLASALLDMKLHLLARPPADLKAFERATLDELGMPTAVVARHRIPQFGHCFAGEGYAAGYYAYLWAEVLSRDAFEAFIQAGDPFDPAVARRYLQTVLSVGNTVDPAQAFRRFRGRDPQVGPLLRAYGFAPAPTTEAAR
ncbi:M3 family metallopeptidase [Ideonella sp. YS5]|uniref:M3 family metallopeptidase n=1 Tax=Ideonella sp. YS5 TaxID=3453714 RepID=UPI003EE89ACD